MDVLIYRENILYVLLNSEKAYDIMNTKMKQRLSSLSDQCIHCIGCEIR
jgi:hypothetical protein